MEKEKQAIHDLMIEWHRATTTGDLTALNRLMAEDVVFLLPGQPPLRGREAFGAAFLAGLQQFRIAYTWQVQEIQIVGDLAYCWNHLAITVRPLHGTAPQRRVGYTLTILRRTVEGQWVISRDANLLTAEASSLT